MGRFALPAAFVGLGEAHAPTDERVIGRVRSPEVPPLDPGEESVFVRRFDPGGRADVQPQALEPRGRDRHKQRLLREYAPFQVGEAPPNQVATGITL